MKRKHSLVLVALLGLRWRSPRAAATTATPATTAATTASSEADRQDRRHPSRHRVLGALGERGPPGARGGLRGGRRRVRHPERRGRRREDDARSPTRMIADGVTVLAIVNLDSESGAAIQEKAASQGVETIDYDRLTLGGSAEYYVSFDNTVVGELQGQGLADCLGDKAANIVYLNGSPTDNNATLFAGGCAQRPRPDDQLHGGRRAGRPGLGQRAGRHDLRAALHRGRRQGRRRARRQRRPRRRGDLRSSRSNGQAGKVPVTGQDATVEGLQNVLAGTQCMTVYKSATLEAGALADAAIALVNGEEAETTGTTEDSEGGRDVPSILLEPRVDHQGQRQGRHRRRWPDGRGRVRRRVRRRCAPRPASPDRRRLTERSDATAPGPGHPARASFRSPEQPILRTGGVPMSRAAARAARRQQELRRGPRPARRRLRRLPRPGHRPRRRQRRRQVHPGQDHRRHLRPRHRRLLLRRQAGRGPRPARRRRARRRGRLPGPRAVRQPRHRPEHVPRPRGDQARRRSTSRPWSPGPARPSRPCRSAP